MREDAQVPGGVPLSEEIFRLNLSYLLLAQRLLTQDEQRAAIALGVRGAPHLLVAGGKRQCGSRPRALPGGSP